MAHNEEARLFYDRYGFRVGCLRMEKSGPSEQSLPVVSPQFNIHPAPHRARSLFTFVRWLVKGGYVAAFRLRRVQEGAGRCP